MQLDLFPDDLLLENVDPSRNRLRFYHLHVAKDLFGTWVLTRRWGRIGRQGQDLAQSFPSAGSATDALNDLVRRKTRRGYHRAETAMVPCLKRRENRY